jgi:hypothetical protein
MTVEEKRAWRQLAGGHSGAESRQLRTTDHETNQLKFSKCYLRGRALLRFLFMDTPF